MNGIGYDSNAFAVVSSVSLFYEHGTGMETASLITGLSSCKALQFATRSEATLRGGGGEVVCEADDSLGLSVCSLRTSLPSVL